MRPAEKRLAELQEQELGLQVPTTLGRNYENESALGSLVADSMREMSKADIAIMNPGGLRADLKKGPLKYGAVFEVFPFDNTVATLEVNGEQLEHMLAAAFGSRKGVFQVSGLEVKLDRCPAPDRFKGATLPGGKPIEKDRTYKVVMPDFLARGGDGLGPFLNTIDPGQVDLGERRGNNIRDELVTFWQEHREAFSLPKTGRVAFQGDGAACAATMKPGAQPGSP
jgi:5'-nucleotidase